MTNWDVRKAVAALDVQIVPFFLNPNEARGVSQLRNGQQVLAIRPGEPHPVFVTLHELAHIVLGHTAEAIKRSGWFKSYEIDNHEIEAHSVALALSKKIGLIPGIDYEPDREAIEYFSDLGTPGQIARHVLSNTDRLRDAVQTIYQAGVREVVTV